MSGVYIKGMEMPDRCFACPMCEVYDAEVNCAISHGSYKEYRDVDEQTAINGRPDFCPLVPVPPHGDLIDRDELRGTLSEASYAISNSGIEVPIYGMSLYGILKAINEAPTIIEAEEEEE